MPYVSHSKYISPTAHYTGYVWYRNGLSHVAFKTIRGRLFFRVLHPMVLVYRLFGGPDLESMLVARHLIIDHLLVSSIEAGRIRQVIEIGAGLSSRGFRFASQYPDSLTYVEGDLAHMAAHKKHILKTAKLTHPNHHLVEINVLRTDGPDSIGAVGDRLFDPNAGTAIITEGLINYFSTDLVIQMWRGFLSFLSRYSQGLYLSDLYLDQEAQRVRGTTCFLAMLSVLARGRFRLHFSDQDSALNSLEAAGFVPVEIHRARDFPDLQSIADPRRTGLVRVIEAWTGAGERQLVAPFPAPSWSSSSRM